MYSNLIYMNGDLVNETNLKLYSLKQCPIRYVEHRETDHLLIRKG